MPRAILAPGVGRIGAKSHRPADRLAARLRLNARLSCHRPADRLAARLKLNARLSCLANSMDL